MGGLWPQNLATFHVKVICVSVRFVARIVAAPPALTIFMHLVIW